MTKQTESVYLVPNDVDEPGVVRVITPRTEQLEEILNTILSKSIQRSEQLQKEINGLQEQMQQEQEYQDRLRADFKVAWDITKRKPEPLELFVGARCELQNGAIVDIVANPDHTVSQHYPFRTRGGIGIAGLGKEITLTADGHYNHTPDYLLHTLGIAGRDRHSYDVKKILNPQDRPNKNS